MLHRNILAGSMSLDELDAWLGWRKYIKRADVLTPEFLAELAADRERGKKLQLENVERLETSPPWPPRHNFVVRDEERQKNREWQSQHKAIEPWKQQPLPPEVVSAILAALQNRYVRLTPEEAARDYALEMLIHGAGAYCGGEGRELVRNLYYACPHEWVRVKFFETYAASLDIVAQADFLFQAMTGDPFQAVRSLAQKEFEDILADWRWKSRPETQSIAEKYAGYKKEMLYGVINTGDPAELVRVIRTLSGQVESDRAFLVEFARNSPYAEARLEALYQLGDTNVIPLAERAAIYRELYQRKDTDSHARQLCISALGQKNYVRDPQNRAIIQHAMNTDSDDTVRAWARQVLDEYEEDKAQNPDEYEDDE